MKRTRLWVIPLFITILLTACARAGIGRPADGASGGEAGGTAVATTPSPEAGVTPAIQSSGGAATILADGALVAARPLLPLAFAGGGRLLAVHVRPGDAVAEGDLLATLDDAALREAVANADLQARQAETTLAEAQLALDDLLNWTPDAAVVAQAEANLAAAEANLAAAQTQDAAAGNNLTAARVNLEQAERALADAQAAYNTAFDPGREWELGVPGLRERLEAERESAPRAVQSAEEALEVAQANYNVSAAGLNRNSALDAQASVAGAQQALLAATTGPTDSEIAAARLRVEAADLTLEGNQLALAAAEADLAGAELRAPWAGVVNSVDAAPGAIIGGGAPVVTVLDTSELEFHTNNLSERDLADVRPGLPATITLKTFPAAPLTGTVARVAPQSAGVIGDAATFVVVIDLDESDLPLRAGMTGRVEIEGSAE
jgi:multidrug efflux pump subunit AcrA (membrane-fusion protein)